MFLHLHAVEWEKALEAIEHLEPESYQKEGVEAVIWALLDSRFPQQEKVDELGEILGEVFALRIKGGETMKMWAARSHTLPVRSASEKPIVNFPDQARGWTLHRSGLTEEQKAVVIARAGGDLNRESVSARATRTLCTRSERWLRLRRCSQSRSMSRWRPWNRILRMSLACLKTMADVAEVLAVT